MATSTLLNSSSPITRRARSSGYLAKQSVEHATNTAPSLEKVKDGAALPAASPRRADYSVAPHDRQEQTGVSNPCYFGYMFARSVTVLSYVSRRFPMQSAPISGSLFPAVWRDVLERMEQALAEVESD